MEGPAWGHVPAALPTRAGDPNERATRALGRRRSRQHADNQDHYQGRCGDHAYDRPVTGWTGVLSPLSGVQPHGGQLRAIGLETATNCSLAPNCELPPPPPLFCGSNALPDSLQLAETYEVHYNVSVI